MEDIYNNENIYEIIKTELEEQNEFSKDESPNIYDSID